MKATWKKIWIPLITVLLLSCNPDKQDKQSAYDDWDEDRDGRITDEEFYTAHDRDGYYDDWDEDKDGIINEREWDAGVSSHYGSYDYTMYGYYGDWDTDGTDGLTRDEFSMGTFQAWDSNDDGILDKSEYEEWYYDRDNVRNQSKADGMDDEDSEY